MAAAVYEKFYKLNGRPFQLNPDPRFFFRSTGHKRAQAYMRYGLQQEEGFIVVTGDVGTGKTTLVSNLFAELDEHKLVAAKIVSTNVKDLDLLRLIAAEFDIPFERSSKATLLNALETFFKACRNDGKRVLLVIDEAQNLPRGALEELRMLSNFQHDGAPLVQSFLLGQREFRTVLRSPGLEQLRQRVIAAYHLKPLSMPEVKSYIEHRLHKVGWADDPAIEPAAFEQVYNATGGVPRRVNTLFDRVLLNAYLDEQHVITGEHVAAVHREIENEQSELLDENAAPSAPAEARAVAPVTPAITEPSELERLERQLRAMQHTIDVLNDKLRQAETQGKGLDERLGLAGALGGGRFPLWTVMFVAILVLAVVVGSVVGWKVIT